MAYTRKTDEEIKTLAMKLIEGQLVTDRHLPPNDEHMLRMVFVPLTLMEKDQLEEMIADDIDLIYGDLSEDTTFPRGVNGFPMFHQIGFLDKEDTKRLIDKTEALKVAVASI